MQCPYVYSVVTHCHYKIYAVSLLCNVSMECTYCHYMVYMDIVNTVSLIIMVNTVYYNMMHNSEYRVCVIVTWCTLAVYSDTVYSLY